MQILAAPIRSTSGRDSSGKPTGMRRHGADRGLATNSPTMSPCTNALIRVGRFWGEWDPPNNYKL
jgi:hypothetical protein